MKVYENRQFPGQQFPFYLRRSTYIHVALFLFTLAGGKVIMDQQKKHRDANIELVQASVKVDMVAMPKYTLNELKNLSSGVEDAKKEEPAPALKQEPEKIVEAEKPVEKKEIEDDPTAFQEASKQKRQSFLSKLKEIGSKKLNSPGNQKADKGLYGEKATDLKQLVLAGNKLSLGTAIYGDSNSADMTAFQAYASRLPDLVRPHWRLPSFLLNKNLKARVRVWLATSGEVIRAEIYQSSGDNEYDQRAVDAVRATSPFPRLSEEFAKRGSMGGILLGFPL